MKERDEFLPVLLGCDLRMRAPETASGQCRAEEGPREVGLVDPAEKSCRACHDAASPSLKPFDFAAKLKAIDHWTIERQKRKAQVLPPLKAAELAQTR